MKLIRTIICAILLIPSMGIADEGMWFLMHIERLNHRDMQKMGLQLTPEEIYSVNNSSLKDAIVQFNGGCTAELISDKGLLLTNHHCGYGAIAELSTTEDNILRDGFWAKNFEEERKPKKLFVRFFVRMDDVTERILNQVNDEMDEEERSRIINQEISEIQKENNEGGKYTVSVRSFYQGNEFYYFVYEDFHDVRLVGTPTLSIGKFGKDTDNWEWPRHTGDFAMFRVYADKNNNPAAYSKENVPYKPKHHLPISLNGIKKGDFSMILGYPGSTNRWLPSMGVSQNIEYGYPAWVEGSKNAMDAMKKFMNDDEKVNLDYTSKYASIANYWKNRQGMIDALQQHKTVKKKQKVEKKFDKWANKKENKEQYGEVMTIINEYYAATNDKSRHDKYFLLLINSSAFADVSKTSVPKLKAFAAMDEGEEKDAMREKLTNEVNEFFDKYHMPLEQHVLASQLELYYKKANFELSEMIQEIGDKNNGNFSTWVKNAFTLSMFTSKDQMLAYLESPEPEMLESDPLNNLSENLYAHYIRLNSEIKDQQLAFMGAYRKYVAGLRESKLSPILYPDANSTLRLTYGKVNPLPKDKRNDAKVNYYTTLKGMVAKHQPGDFEFDLTQELIDLYNKGDFGPYADPAGHMPVCFLTDHDITGGNSGSPVLNGKGELIGLAFDGNIEGIAGDVIFDPKLQRTINVDVRFILLIVDKLAGAQNIIDELTIVKD
ncbi:MAG: S46 family peptidase [Cryomorphaceae bacterium]|nr:S46 family peptidase [Cryomorphaceae bacterium]